MRRESFDFARYVERIQTGPCFICEMLRGNLNGNDLVYQVHSARAKTPTSCGPT